MTANAEWAKRQRAELLAEIQHTEARAGLYSEAEELGLLRASDRLPVLRQRLSQVEHLIEVVDETEPMESGWPAFLGDPRTTTVDITRRSHC
jgi:hypothetical protein